MAMCYVCLICHYNAGFCWVECIISMLQLKKKSIFILSYHIIYADNFELFSILVLSTHDKKIATILPGINSIFT